MTSNCIKYKAGFKYQLVEDYGPPIIPIHPPKDIITDWVILKATGELIVKAGFAWDGPSGPTIDRKTNMRGSVDHDALYRLIRYGNLPLSVRSVADDIIRQRWIEDGMWEWVARTETGLLKRFGSAAARPSGEPLVMTAP